jgi:2-oxoglutarate dehydrogenase E1 component
LKKSYEASKKQSLDKQAWISKPWENIIESGLFGQLKDTGIPLEILLKIGKEINTLPETLKAHPQIVKIFQQRLHSIEKGEGIDFATAEALALASLIYEGYGVRISGQDVKRGTFSHRHAVLYDQDSNVSYMPLKAYCDKMKNGPSSIFSINNSSLSEFGVLGFEYGYSIANHNVLVCWEAQFGDFANGAQVIIDNYITSGEYKWGIQSGLTMMLPHGMDGQGPEHSSANMHRYLQAMDDDIEIVSPSRVDRVRKQIMESNMQIVYCTTSANYFHVLRRQMRRKFRKPLIIFASKSLLRFKGVLLINFLIYIYINID